MINRAACSYVEHQSTETELFYEIGKALLLLANNEETVHRYLDLDYDMLLQAIK